MSLLRKAFQINRLIGNFNKITRNLNTHSIQTPKINPSVFQIKFHEQNHWIYNEKHRIQLPITSINSLRFPTERLWTPLEEPTDKIEKIIEDPVKEENEIKVERLIVIRRKKMKKHKLRKLRKRMKFEYAKIKQKRELKREKEFHAELIQQCKKGDKFSAEEYVNERLQTLHQSIQAAEQAQIELNRRRNERKST